MASFDVLSFGDFSVKEVKALVRSRYVTSSKSWLGAILAVKNDFGANKHLGYMEAMARLQREWKVRDKRIKVREHAERQCEWMAGGRTNHWLKKVGPYGSTEAAWFRKRLERLTGMSTREADPRWGYATTEEVVEEEWEWEFPCRARPAPQPRCPCCYRRGCLEEVCEPHRLPNPHIKSVSKTSAVRSLVLLKKLWKVLDRLREKRGAYRHVYVVHKAVHQMDNDEHGEGAPTLVKTSNVIVTEQHAASDTAEVSAKSQFRMVCGDNVNTFESSVNRPFVYKIVEWKTSQGFNTKVLDARLPRDFVSGAKDTVNTMPFTVHRYFRGDILVRVQLNSNKFMAGQLQIAWWYQPDDDAAFDDRNNISSASQTLHTLLNAGTSNEAVLRIPYRYFKSALEVGARTDKELSLNMGSLIIRVLNPLSVTSASATSCYFTIFVSFENAEFGGNVKATRNKLTKARHQMETAAAMVAAGAVTKFFDANRDKPTTSSHPMYVAPQPAQSWCLGNGESEAAYSLRLTSAQVPHPSSYADDSFTVSSLVSRYGYVAQQIWKSSDMQGTQLFAIPVLPMCDPSNYLRHTKDQISTRILPPVAYLSNLFQFWRGSLKYRFDFVATAMHTGRLILGYIPGDYIEDATIDDLYASPATYFDLKESQQLEIEVPFVSDKMFWPRHLNPSTKRRDMLAPSYLYCFVVAPLAVMDSIKNQIEFNIYIAGGGDFELAVPAQPSIGLSFNPKHSVPKGDLAFIKTGYYPAYVGTFTDLVICDKTEFGSSGEYYGILRYGIVYGHISQFYLPKQKDEDTGYYLKASNFSIMVRSDPNKPATTQCNILIPWYDDGGYVYALPARSSAVAEDWIRNCLKYNYDFTKFLSPTNTPKKYFFVYPKGDDNDEYQLKTNPGWEVVAVSKPADTELFHSFGPASFHPNYPQLFADGYAQHQIDNRFDSEAPTMSLKMHSMPQSCSRMMFGEDYNDLKDLCRRYQPYASVNIKKDDLSKFIPGDVLFKFPVLPQGLALDETNVFSNSARDGLIPMLLNGYRYFRGSLRFRISFPPGYNTYFIQHKPYIPFKEAKVVVLSGGGKDTDTLINHGYAYTIINAEINTIGTIEVPFYVPFDSVLLQQPIVSTDKFKITDVNMAYSMGEVHVGILSGNSVGTQAYNIFNVVYSFGDDARPSVFQGFSPVIVTQDIPIKTDTATHQMLSSIKSSVSLVKDLNKLDLVNTNAKVQDTLLSLEQTSTDFSETLSAVKAFAGAGVQGFEQFMANLKTSGAPTILINAFGQIIHVINNPVPSTMAISLCNFLLTLGIISFEALGKLSSIFSSLFLRLRPQHLNGETAPVTTATHEIEDADGVAVVSMLFAGISTAMNVKCQMGSKFSKGLAHDLLDGITSGCKDGSFFFRFLSNVIGTIMKIFDYLKKKLFPVELGLENLLQDQDVIIRWAEEAIILSDPQNEPLFDVMPAMVERVNMCFSIGSLIMTRIVNAPKAVNIAAFRDLYSKINTLRTMLADKGLASAIRREPFVVCMLGAPGIGKSQMSTKIILNMVNAAKIPFNACPIYTHPAGAKYWENVNQEPVLFMDDSLILRSGETMDTELSVLMSLKSCALFSPPIAACDRKKKRYAPELVYMHTNTAFPEVNNMQCPEALYRRRDMMWEAQLIDERTVKDYTGEQLDECEHLRFRRHANPRDKTCLEWSEWHTYAEFSRVVTQEFIDFRAAQLAAHAKKIDFMTKAVEEINLYPEFNKLPLAEIIANYKKYPIFEGLTMYSNNVVGDHQIGTSETALTFISLAHSVILAPTTPQHIRTAFTQLCLPPNISSSLRTFFDSKGQYCSLTLEDLNNLFLLVSDPVYGPKIHQIYPNSAIVHCGSWITSQISRMANATKFTQPPPAISPKPSTSDTSSIDEILAALADPSNQVGNDERISDEEDLNIKLKKNGGHICDTHLAEFIADTKAHDVLMGKGLFAGKKIEEDKLVDTYRIVLEKFGCKHLFIYKRPYVVDLSESCCFTKKEIRHFCRTTKVYTNCTDDCIMNSNLPLFDNFDCCGDVCVRNNKRLLDLSRQLYILHHEGMVKARVERLAHCPLILFEKPVLETLHRFKKSITDMLCSIKDFVYSFFKRIFGIFDPVRKFLQNYWKPLLSVLGVLLCGAGALAFRKSISNDSNEPDDSHSISLVDSIKDKARGYSTYFKNRFSNKVPLDTDNVVEPDSNSDGSASLAEGLSATHHIIASGDTRSGGRAARVAFKAARIANTSALGVNASHQIAHEEVVANRIIDNTICLIALKEKNDTVGHKQIRALALGDRYVLTVLHAWEIFNYFEYKYIQCFVKDRPIEIQIDSIKASPIENSSLVVLRMPANFPQFKSITQFFASEADHMYRAPNTGTLVIVGNVNKFFDCKISVQTSNLVIDGVEGASQVIINNVYKYKTQAPGMCGSLLCGDLLNCPIIGMHIAGNGIDNVGYAVPLFKETFMDLFNIKITKIEEPTFLPIDDTLTVDLQTTVFPVGSVGKQMAHHSPVQSNIHQSAIHGYVPPVTAPAPLTANDERLPPGNSPLIKGCEKHGIVTENFPQTILNITYERLRTHLFTHCKPLRQGRLILSDSQAVVGDSQLPYCDPLNWNSSEGYPYYKYRPAGATDKKWCFKLQETPEGFVFQGFHPLVNSLMSYKRTQREQGVPQPTLFTDCLKDARISLEKVSVPGKTRIFSMSPVDYTVDFRKYFYDFIASYQVNRLENFNAIGINKFSIEWDTLARNLLRNHNVCTGDYSNFGPGLNEEVARLCMDLILEWFDKFDVDQTLEEARTRACLAYELIGSYHLCHDLVYRVVAGIPSGSPITVVLNSLVNTFYIFAAWEMLKYTFPIEYQNFDAFYKFTVLYTYGDDFIMSVASPLVEYFNTATIASCLAKFDIKMTDAFKGDTITPYAPLEKSTFLKGSFTLFFDRYWYGLDQSQIYDMVNFVNSKHNKVMLTKENAQAALLEAHGHGPAFFRLVKSKIVQAFIRIGETFQGRTFEECTDLKIGVADDPELRAMAKKIMPLF